MARTILSVFVLSALLLFIDAANDFEAHPCNRDCIAGDPPLVCEYELHIEAYSSMSKACYMCPWNVTDCDRQDCVPADGFARQIYAVNRQLPSPLIRVCEGDTLKVKIKNHMTNGEGTSMHWHGIHQMNAIHQDGVSMLTQCPILPLTEFEYRFKASPHGTHFYHAHVGMQRGEGVAGALVVRPLKDVHRPLYNYDLTEHTIVIQDWFLHQVSNKAHRHFHARDNNRPDTIIINGRAPDMVTWPEWNTDTPEADAQIPYRTFNVRQNSAYRFRVISNVVMNCPIEVYVEGHRLTAISSDGADVEPVATDVIVVSGGERWDFVLKANATVGNYWVYFRGLTDCSQRKTQSIAVLHYEGAADEEPTTTANTYDQRPQDVWTLNPFSLGMVTPDETDKHLTLTELRSMDPEPAWLSEQPSTKVYLNLGLHKINSPLFNVPTLYGWENFGDKPGGTVLAQINRVHGALPAWPYLSQYADIPQDQFCDVNSPEINEEYCSKNFCHCAHRLRVKLGEVVELIMLDRGKHWNISNHPMHIHGQFLHIIAVGQNETMITSTELVKELDLSGDIARNFVRPIKKDTVMMPDGGYVVGRFKADNPGPWFLHCHNEAHVEQGMSMVIQVGEPDEWPQNPQETYKCGSVKHSSQYLAPAPVPSSVDSPAASHFLFLVGTLTFLFF